MHAVYGDIVRGSAARVAVIGEKKKYYWRVYAKGRKKKKERVKCSELVEGHLELLSIFSYYIVII